MEFYNKLGSKYDELHGEEQRKKFFYVNQITPLKGDILDIGCGDAQLSKYFNLNYYGVEPSQELILQSPYKKFFDIKKIQICTAENMQIKKKFDFITSFTALHHIKDIDLVLQKIKKGLKKDGTFICTIIKRSPSIKKIESALTKQFETKKYEQEKDTIYICKDKL